MKKIWILIILKKAQNDISICPFGQPFDYFKKSIAMPNVLKIVMKTLKKTPFSNLKAKNSCLDKKN
ncbi:MAG TPA: hypothetical protein VIL23_04820 [Clostridia bacterium]